ncbi:MAG: ribosomal protein S17 [uncultured bacterium]|nr:MAG: ribosomal protein S17 [uncultured bacterium]KKU15125.1 MAG: 30S ribosomal protein S17 [Microgenomates group bacterium GW2011_GWC2_45_8]KKU26331.1 MAG: 30S ribosomal protein S17 [Microgenomates group bacterium GW2011_GWA2_46_16]
MKIISAKVLSARLQGSAVVVVETSWKHPLYQKSVKRSKKFLVQNDLQAVAGNFVEIQETRPLSARKHFTITKIINNL